MELWQIALIVIAAIVVISGVALMMNQRKRTEHLTERYGPEYQRTLEATGDKREAERDLQDREERVKKNEKREGIDRNGDQPRSEDSGHLTTAQVAAVQHAAAHEERKGGTRTPVRPGSTETDVDSESEPLFDEAAIGKHRERWQAIQAD